MQGPARSRVGCVSPLAVRRILDEQIAQKLAYESMMNADDMKAKLAAGQAATVASLRRLADELERLPLNDAAEVLAWLNGSLEQLRRDAATIMRGGYDLDADPLGGASIIRGWK